MAQTSNTIPIQITPLSLEIAENTAREIRRIMIAIAKRRREKGDDSSDKDEEQRE